MKKNLLALAICCLALSGCFNITEEIFLEKNGSGRYVSTIDLSQMKDMLDMVKSFAPDSTNGGEMNMANLDSVENMWGDLSGIPGISDIKKEKKDNNVYAVSFRFKDIGALNEAMRKKNKKEEITGDFYSFSPGNFSCNDTSMSGMNEALKGMNTTGEANDSVAMAMTMMKGMMGDMKYTTIYHFPGKVTSYSNKEAKLSEDGKTLTLELRLMDESQQNKTLLNKVSYKK